MHLVDVVDFVATLGRRILHGLAQVTNLIDTVVAGTIDLQHVQTIAFGDLFADWIVRIELNARPAGTIQRLGKDTGRGSLARAAWPHEQISMSQTVLCDGIAERAHHMILTEHIGEGLRAVFTGENLVAHERSDSERGERCKGHRVVRTVPCAASGFEGRRKSDQCLVF